MWRMGQNVYICVCMYFDVCILGMAVLIQQLQMTAKLEVPTAAVINGPKLMQLHYRII